MSALQIVASAICFPLMLVGWALLFRQIGRFVALYRVDRFPKGVVKQVDILSRMAELTAEAMPKLRSMKDLSAYWIEINRLENRADKAYRRMLAELFNEEGADAILVMKLKEIIDELEAAADAFETVAHKVESIAVKES